jgi:hypothetical protein
MGYGPNRLSCGVGRMPIKVSTTSSHRIEQNELKKAISAACFFFLPVPVFFLWFGCSPQTSLVSGSDWSSRPGNHTSGNGLWHRPGGPPVLLLTVGLNVELPHFVLHPIIFCLHGALCFVPNLDRSWLIDHVCSCLLFSISTPSFSYVHGAHVNVWNLLR